MNKRKKIVITGASGFLGRHLVERIKGDERYMVYALSSRPDELREKLGGENVVYCHKDYLDTADMLKDAIIVNCAYPRNSIGTAIADGLKYIQRVFESGVENEAVAIINISSQSVYSQQRMEAATEETPLCLESMYAVGKYAVELMLESICRGSRTSYTSLRMASLIGPGFDQRIVNRLVEQAYAGKVLHVIKSDQRFGFLDIEDAVSAITAFVKRDNIHWRPLYTVGNSEAYSIMEIANCINSVFDELGLKFPGIQIEYGNSVGKTSVGYQQIQEDIGFEPTYSLNGSIFKILNGIQNNK